MSWFKKKFGQKKRGLYKVLIEYEVLVNANNESHAVNQVFELRNDLWEATRPYVLKFSMHESAKAKKS